MTEYFSYITKDGDRWDLIANKFYKNPSKYEPIIKANPDVPITPIQRLSNLHYPHGKNKC